MTIRGAEPGATDAAQGPGGGVGEATAEGLAGGGVGLRTTAVDEDPHATTATKASALSARRHGITPS